LCCRCGIKRYNALVYYKPFKEEERKEKYLENKYPNFKEKHVEHHPKKN